ncbi:riboflavin synthase subunit alpha [Piscirickettsia salmonis]|uniref:riboflavin synthase subunit alpha n=1 Tax=Piscirickettsia salmonis TaxID=1238 RepID=UPI003EB83BAB
MYTGITKGVFPVVELEKKDQLTCFSIQLPDTLTNNLKIGASVNLDGVCHTVTAINNSIISFTSGAETLKLTTFNELYLGRTLSVERSHITGEENGGHTMYGHVIGRATVKQVIIQGDNLNLRLSCNSEWMKYILYKGFISVDGCSLTVGQTSSHGEFEINLIPETLRITNFSYKKQGDQLNIEIDPTTYTIVTTLERIMGKQLKTHTGQTYTSFAL